MKMEVLTVSTACFIFGVLQEEEGGGGSVKRGRVHNNNRVNTVLVYKRICSTQITGDTNIT